VSFTLRDYLVCTVYSYVSLSLIGVWNPKHHTRQRIRIVAAFLWPIGIVFAIHQIGRKLVKLLSK